MNNLFNGCQLNSLLEFSNWNTSNVENISGMFSGCSSLVYLPDIQNWNTINVTNMSNLFAK